MVEKPPEYDRGHEFVHYAVAALLEPHRLDVGLYPLSLYSGPVVQIGDKGRNRFPVFIYAYNAAYYPAGRDTPYLIWVYA